MSSSTILDDDVEKETQAQRPHHPDRLGLTRTRSSLDEALDAAANIDEDEDESGPPVNNTATSPADHAPPPN
ncbi:hypothetical protein ABEF94_000044, partial [Exophiala dermatitidis]